MASSNIKAIDKASVHRITSGQVVVDLQTAVKELVENSLDAGATNIEIRFKTHGFKSVEVIDNGSGIAQDNFESIALKHHTSKLETYEDLSLVETFGFRGEALSSLCALCEKVSVTTATKDASPKGTCLEMLKTGEVGSRSVVARQQGTTVSLVNLFSPLPVRRKEFERNLKREFGKALTLLHAYALVPCSSETPVRLSVANFSEKGQKSLQLQTYGKPSIKAAVSSLWGSAALDNLVDLDISFEAEVEKSLIKRLQLLNQEPLESTTVQVKGLISKFAVGCGRANMDRQFFYVNGRPCTLPKVQKAINEVYRTFNMNQSPFIVANFIIPTTSCDVNVSPDKRTILVHNESNLITALKATLESHFSPSRSTFDLTETQTLTQSVLSPVVISRRRSERQPVVNEVEKQDGVPSPSEPVVEEVRTEGLENLETTLSPSRQTRPSGRAQKVASQSRAMPMEVDPPSPQSSGPLIAALLSSTPPSSRGPDLVIDTTKSKWSITSTPHQSRVSSMTSGISSSQTAPTSPSPSPLPQIPSEEEHGDPYFRKGRMGNGQLAQPREKAGNRLAKRPLSTRRDHTPSPPRKKRTFTRDSVSLNIASFALPGSQAVLPSAESPQELSDDSQPSAPPKISPRNRSEGCTSDREDKQTVEPPLIEATNGPTSPTEDVSSVSGDAASAGVLPREALPPIEFVRHTDASADIPVKLDLNKILHSWKSHLSSATPGSYRTAPDADNSVKVPSDAGVQNSQNNERAADALSRVIDKSDFASMDILGQFNLGFIICRRRKALESNTFKMDDLFVVDQHASDEKYNFETLQLTTKIQSQKLLRPRPLELTAADELVANENLQILKDNGFEVRAASDHDTLGARLQLTAQPVSKNTVFDMKDLEELIHLLRDTSSGTMVRCSKARAMFASRACRKSVMVGMALNQAQMTTVVRHMGTIDQPWNCPHGRPTMRHLADISSLSSLPLKTRPIDWASLD